MANVMFSKNGQGELVFYLPKKDLEEVVVSIERDDPEAWGGELELADGTRYYVEPIPAPRLPITLRAKRL